MTPITPGKYYSYPLLGENKRKAEGGLRLQVAERSNISSDNHKLVSVVTVCRNSERTLVQCIESVLSQSYKNIELIIIDGASTDGTIEILKDFDSTIEYFVSECDNGIYHAMNKGIELSKGEFIIFLNSDDWYEKTCIEELLASLENSNAHFATAQAIYRDNNGEHIETLRQMSFDESVYIRMPLRHETMLIPSYIYNQIGAYDENLKIIGDSDFAIRLFEAGFKNVEISKGLLNFRNTGASNTQQSQKLKERVELLLKHFPHLKESDVRKLASPHQLTPEIIQDLAYCYSDHIKFSLSLLGIYQEKVAQLVRQDRWQSSSISFPAFEKPGIAISVIIPLYNAEKSIKDTLLSVLNQDFAFGNIECICIDDASNDSSSAIISKLVRNDKRLVYVRNDRNIGQGPSRNKGKSIARGKWIFFVDADDTIPSDSLSHLYKLGELYKSDIVRGAFIISQSTPGNKRIKPEKKSFVNENSLVSCTTLKEMPSLLKSTEGHWANLYDSKLARSVDYPDLRMGQDSIFLIRVLSKARRICVTDKVVYNYKSNMDSVMNTPTFHKYMASIRWRVQAFHSLKYILPKKQAQRFMLSYWNDRFLEGISRVADPLKLREFVTALHSGLDSCLINQQTLDEEERVPPLTRQIFSILLSQDKEKVVQLLQATMLKVATFCTMDYGGAGTGSRRRVKHLRMANVDATLYSLFSRSASANIKTLRPLTESNPVQLLESWRNKVTFNRSEYPKLRASELFTKTECLISFLDNKEVIHDANIIHLHWVAGVLDLKNLHVLSDKPVVWTLADMNAFTGGCHYSEGCTQFEKSCKDCPLLPESSLPHEAWLLKKAAYSKLKNLTIICPSPWLAELAKKSSLLSGREIIMIPNPIPNSFKPFSKVLARIRLGLPLHKKLILFGADNLQNKRKGGKILEQSLAIMKEKNQIKDLEGISFGENIFNTCIPFHSMGRINDEETLSLIYSAADCYAFPSLEDNAPLTISESLISGTPVVAFDVGNVTEVVKHKYNGFVARNFSPDSFAGGVNFILRSREIRSYSRSIEFSAKAKRYHDPNISIQRHLNVYNRAISTSN